jgi:uncharacterized protein (TIGR01777 family)
VIHLAGATIAARWSARRRREILESRSQGTGLIARAIAAAPNRPRLLVSASAIGYYGDRGEEVLTEAAGSGTGFLPEVTRGWEQAAEPARAAGVRVVHPRFGVVLSAAGGALPKMLPAFVLGLGATLGSGRQWMSWVSLDDAVASLVHLLGAPVSGPVNVVAPGPVRNREFTDTLARVLRRPAFAIIPAPILRMALGGLADEGLLASARVEPAALAASGYQFRHATLESALRHQLGRERGP